MVAGDHEHVGLQIEDAGDMFVQFLEALHLAIKVAVFTGGVGGFVVDEEKVVIVPVGVQGVHLVAKGHARGNDPHVGDGSETPVHRISGDGRRVQMIYPPEFRKIGKLSPSPEQNHVGGLFLGQKTPGLGYELPDDFGGKFTRGLQGSRRAGRQTLALGVGLFHRFGQTLAAQAQHEPVVLHRHHVHLDAGDLDTVEALTQRSAQLGPDPARPTVGQQARVVHGAEVAARGQRRRAAVRLRFPKASSAPRPIRYFSGL